jgi:nicotinamidase-related amidase
MWVYFMVNAALLVVDMQSGNFESNPVHMANDLLKKTKNLIQKARASHVLVIYIQNNGGKGDPDEYGSDEWKIHPSIAPIKGEVLVQKKTPDAFYKTNLNEELKSRQITHLIVAGLQTEYCIDTTCRRAFSLGYNVTLVKDAHSTWDTPILSATQIIEHHNSVLSGFFVTLKDEKEIMF